MKCISRNQAPTSHPTRRRQTPPTLARAPPHHHNAGTRASNHGRATTGNANATALGPKKRGAGGLVRAPIGHQRYGGGGARAPAGQKRASTRAPAVLTTTPDAPRAGWLSDTERDQGSADPADPEPDPDPDP